ncbi:PKD domain-containing protein [Natronorubrum sp. A-ect3]|uniref:PKD domain-containing protein n=1 Tax=Natronorubrum sp. A-ect3 TaxID=3242698 RepID=UPI00359ED17F
MFTERRTLLKATGGCLAGVAAIGAGSGHVRGNEPNISITFEDQESDRRSVVIKEVTTDKDIFVTIRDENDSIGRTNLDAGVATDVTITLTDPIAESQTLSARAYPASGGSRLARDDALVSVDDDLPERIDGVEPQRIDANPDAGFNYPYYLYAPDTFEDEEPKSLLVEPTNTGTTSDEFEEHRKAGERTISGGLGRQIADELFAPFIVPVFPRPREEPVDGTHYVHQLDDTTMSLESGPLERVDLQLLSMVEHAQDRLTDQGYPVAEGIMLNGFSASGNFVDRFTMLHPDRVLSVTAGGLNGMAILPLEEAEGHTLPYHVGIADVAELTGEPADLDALDEVNQFLYMGEEDNNDTIPYGDAWTDDELRQTALEVYGDDMIEERFPRCQEAYQEAGVEAQFRVYEDAGHTPQPATDDIVAFHRRSLEGEDVSEFGQTIRATPEFESTPENPAVGDTVELDASNSEGGTSDITNYLWEFGTGDTAVGETVTYTYEDAGEQIITLTVILENGGEREFTDEITVTEADNISVKDEKDNDKTETDSVVNHTEDDETGIADETDDDSDDDGSPGFGVMSALAGLGGVGYLLKHGLLDSTEQE